VRIGAENDAAAYLGPEPLGDANANQYVGSSGGTLEINVVGSGAAGPASTRTPDCFDELFEATDQGTQDGFFYVTTTPTTVRVTSRA